MRESEFEFSRRRAEFHGSRVPGYLFQRRSATTPLACDYALRNALFTLGEHRLLYSRAIEGTSERIVLGFFWVRCYDIPCLICGLDCFARGTKCLLACASLASDSLAR